VKEQEARGNFPLLIEGLRSMQNSDTLWRIYEHAIT
jgi:hypothetical protein